LDFFIVYFSFSPDDYAKAPENSDYEKIKNNAYPVN
jgi:hypothetical protein